MRTLKPFSVLLLFALAAPGLLAHDQPPAGSRAGFISPASIDVRARAVAPGEVLLVTVSGTSADAPVTLRAFGREWPTYADGSGRRRALVGIDLDTRPGPYAIEALAASGHVARAIEVRRRVFPTRRLTVNPDLVNPPPESLERIEREAREFEALWKSRSPERRWSGGFVRPVPDAANSAFGTRSVYNGEARAPHSGADFLSPAGRPVKAPAAGRIVIADARYFTGNTVVIDHGMGLYSMLAHLSSMDVAVGDDVVAGQVVANVGATGRVTGPHLHWSVRLDGARVDPLSLLDVVGAGARSGVQGALHQGEQRRNRGDLPDPEDERPAKHLDSRGGELGAERGQALVQ